jgi:2-dehydropantoate 2-reductase
MISVSGDAGAKGVRIVVIGAGGVGGYFGGRLARAGARVTFVARGAHLEALRSKGLRVVSTIEGEWSAPVEAVEDPTGIDAADAVLLSVKSFDTEAALGRIRPVVGEGTPVLSLQNGVDSIERIDEALGAGHALGGAAYVFATIQSPGVIAHRFAGRIVFGEPDGRATDRAERLRAAFAAAGVPVELSADIRRVLWEKYIFICAHAGMTALVRAPHGVIRSTPETWRMYGAIVEEIATLGRAAGVALPPDAAERVMKTAETLDPGNRSSLYHDLAEGKRLEVEALHGHAVRLAETLAIPTPMTFAVYAALKPHALGRRD